METLISTCMISPRKRKLRLLSMNQIRNILQSTGIGLYGWIIAMDLEIHISICALFQNRKRIKSRKRIEISRFS